MDAWSKSTVATSVYSWTFCGIEVCIDAVKIIEDSFEILIYSNYFNNMNIIACTNNIIEYEFNSYCGVKCNGQLKSAEKETCI